MRAMGGAVHRPPHSPHTASPEPLECRVEQVPRHLIVVHGFEVADLAHDLTAAVGDGVVDDRRDPAHQATFGFTAKTAQAAVGPERVHCRELFADARAHRRYPCRVALMQPPWEINEGIDVRLIDRDHYCCPRRESAAHRTRLG